MVRGNGAREVLEALLVAQLRTGGEERDLRMTKMRGVDVPRSDDDLAGQLFNYNSTFALCAAQVINKCPDGDCLGLTAE